MVNLILDTQNWIYLANGSNPETNKNDEESHFQMSKWILDKIENKKCRNFSNDIIKIEWERNKEKCNELINRYEKRNIQNSNELRNERKSSNYLKLAAEFRKSDADAAIFLSTVDYFFYDVRFYIDNTIFISNNTSDFSEPVTNKELHPELAKMLMGKPIVIETNLAQALNLGDEIIANYQKYIDFLNRDCIGCLMDCKGVEYGMTEVEFKDFVEIDIGACDFCNATHIRCDCGEEHASYEDDIECSCGKSFSIENGIDLMEEE